MFVEIRPVIVSDAELRIRRFYYSNKLSFSLGDQVQNIDVDILTFYFIHEDTTIETIQFPVEPLFNVDEVWIDYLSDITDAKLYTEKVFDSYSYFVRPPF